MVFLPAIVLLVWAVFKADAATQHFQLNGQNTATVTTANQKCCDGNTREVTTDLTAVLFDKSTVRTNFGSNVDNRMVQLDKHQGDQKGHILASVLGGPAQVWNLAPQAENVNKKVRKTTSILNSWYDCEKWIQTQLETHAHLPITVMIHLTYSSAGGCRPTHWSILAHNNGNTAGCEARNVPNGIDPTFGVCQRPR